MIHLSRAMPEAIRLDVRLNRTVIVTDVHLTQDDNNNKFT